MRYISGRMIAAALIMAITLLAYLMGRQHVSIASELKAAKDAILALEDKLATVVTGGTDPAVTDAITGLTSRLDALTTLVGTADELNPPA